MTALDTLALGQSGMDLIDNTTAVTGDWGVITALTAATFTLLTVRSPLKVNGSVATNLNTKTLPAGQSLYGRFSAITLSGGAVAAYWHNMKTP